MPMKPNADSMLVECVCSHDACTRIKREYGHPWPPAILHIRQLEDAGLLRFVSIHREPGSNAMIRRSTITDAGLAEIGASGVLGLPPTEHVYG